MRWNMFASEDLEKTSADVAKMKGTIDALRAAVKANPNLVKYPLIAAGGAAGYKTLERGVENQQMAEAMREQMAGK